MDDVPRDTLIEELQNNCCPPLDPALFRAIVSDFDLSNQDELQELRRTLDALKLSAWEQEDLPFDPSGTSGLSTAIGLDADGVMSDRSVSGNGVSGSSHSRETDVTSLASDLSSVTFSDSKSRFLNNSSQRSSCSFGKMVYIVGPDGSAILGGANFGDKVQYLAEMFPSIDSLTIRHTLKNCNGDVDRSMDHLLNLAFFDGEEPTEDGTKISIPKGIDGFAEKAVADFGQKNGKKRKTKSAVQRNREITTDLTQPEPLHSQVGAANGANKWDTVEKEVEFIFSLTCSVLKKVTVRSAYHANGASLGATIRSLAMSHAPKDEVQIGQDPELVSQVAELQQQFPAISLTTLGGLLILSGKSTLAASELAAAMSTRPPQPSVMQDIIQVKSPAVVLDDNRQQTATITPNPPRDFHNSRIIAGSHFMASSDAFAKASAAYKRSKSDRLMGGAAAYYSALGRDYMERAKREASFAADALVDSQSTSTMLDLHGVSVPDAVRIARERVSEWWESLGDSKYVRGTVHPAKEGYHIVTGVGRHSHDGTARLGPAVGKMLAREGWKVEVGDGILFVTGMADSR